MGYKSIIQIRLYHLDESERLVVSKLGYTCHIQPDRIHLLMDSVQTMAYLKKKLLNHYFSMMMKKMNTKHYKCFVTYDKHVILLLHHQI